MKKSNSEQVGDILRRFMRDEGLETPLNQFRLMSAWKDVMGDGIEQYTGDMFIKNQTLFVKIKSSVLKNNLMMMRTSLVDKLNNTVNAQVITDIHFV
ncbi:MAG: DUF721 domain-containing protein [Bacteroidales bacterium]|nr:DUF721 domain-containing protein [Bacteroidales bacterium]